ncbi:hypothetical protein EDD22DRAFT_851512 [Suillus occidentalis]|nr:hypothetical protein EDD22DRAFT_851512 [Suillus occidentalis]
MPQAKNIILNLLDDPNDFQNLATILIICYLRVLEGYAAATILKVAYEETTPTPTEPVKLQMLFHSNENVGPSFAKYALENEHLYGLTEIEIAYLAGAFLELESKW